MKIRRFRNIVAIQDEYKNGSDSFSAFHSDNLEVAAISKELFSEMSPIDLDHGNIPTESTIIDAEVRRDLVEWDNERNLEVKTGKITSGIRSITINVNQICNLKCSYCAAGGDGTFGDPLNNIDVKTAVPLLEPFIMSIKANGRFSVTFVGGEPLLHFEVVKQLYDHISLLCKTHNIVPSFTLVTNGTRLAEDVVWKYINQLKIKLTISLDGEKEVNDLVRPSKSSQSSTELTLKGLRNISLNRGSIESVGIAAVYTEQNQNLIKNYQFFKSLNVDWVEFSFPYHEKSKELQDSYLNQMYQIAEIAWLNGGESELRKISFFDHYFKLLDNQQRIENHCGVGKSYIVMDARSNLYSCPWEVGNKLEMVLEKGNINQDFFKKYEKSLIDLNSCHTCWARYLCGGGCMFIHKSHTGSKHSKDPLFCERTRGLLLKVIMYYKLSRGTSS